MSDAEYKHQPIAFTEADIAKDRKEALRETASGLSMTQKAVIEHGKPGSYTAHEALQMASVFMDMVDRHLMTHPTVVSDPDFFRYAHEAHTNLFNLYQAIGAKHL